MKVADIDWDEGNWPKCGGHGVSRVEIERLFRSSPSVYADPTHSRDEQRLRAIGRTAGGRWLFVAFTLRQRDGKTFVRPVSARYMHRKEVSAYARRKDAEKDAGSPDR